MSYGAPSYPDPDPDPGPVNRAKFIVSNNNPSPLPLLPLLVAAKFTRPVMSVPKPLVPSTDDKPIMGLKTSKNFIVANAVENILAVPRNLDEGDRLYVQKQDYGKVPEYLGKVKEAIETEKEIMMDYMQQETYEATGPEDTYTAMSEDARETLIHDLKLKWDEVNKSYQKMAHIVTFDTINKLRSKERNEKMLGDLEKHIDKLEKAQGIALAN